MFHRDRDARPILNALDRELKLRGRGAISDMESALGFVRGSGWWQRRLRVGDIAVSDLIAILDYLGLHPVRFIRKSLTDTDPLELPTPTASAPELVLTAQQRFGSNPDFLGTVGADTLRTLDMLRYQEPREALNQVSLLLQYSSRESIPSLLGVAGSCWRLLLCLSEAEHSILAGIRMAQELEDPSQIGSLLQRLAYVKVDRGELDEAIKLSEEVAVLYLRAGQGNLFAKSLVDMGIWLSRVGRHRESIEVSRFALELLPEEEVKNRCTAQQVMSIGYRVEGELSKARGFLEAAELTAQALPDGWADDKLLWLRATIEEGTGNLVLASDLLWKVLDRFAASSLADMALVACDLARVEILRGRPLVAFQSAAKLRFLVEPLSHNEIVSAAIARLLRLGEHGMTLALVSEVKTVLERELSRAEAVRALRNERSNH